MQRRVALLRARRNALVMLTIGCALAVPLRAADPVHLLGFVDRLCADEPYCFELRVKPAYHALVGARIRVRFADAQAIFDPENYELTLAQQNIVPGSHLRMVIEADAARGEHAYRASFIWIGD